MLIIDNCLNPHTRVPISRNVKRTKKSRSKKTEFEVPLSAKTYSAVHGWVDTSNARRAAFLIEQYVH